MRRISSLLYLIVITAIFIIEGFGISNGRQIAYAITLLAPFILFSLDICMGLKIVYPVKLTIVYIFFLLFSLISTVYSLQVQKSFDYLLLYFSSFLIFIYIYNHKKEIAQNILKIIFLISLLCTGYFLLTPFIIRQHWFFLLPQSKYNFVLSSYQSHNHLGNLLVLPLVSLLFLYLKQRKRIYIFLCAILFLPFIFSYSRSAYLTMLVLGTLLIFAFRRGVFVLAFTLISAFFFFSVTYEAKSIPIFSQVNGFLQQKFELRSKSIIAQRDIFFSQAIEAWKERPFYGYGPQNFSLAAIRNIPQEDHWSYQDRVWALSSHNLFLDVLSENGMFASIFFVIFIVLIILYGQKTLFWLLFLALLINFQTDYSHRFYSLLTLFFVLGGLVYKEKKEYSGTFITLCVSTILVIVLNARLFSSLLQLNNQKKLAWYVYPFNQKAHKYLMLNSYNEKKYEESLRLSILYAKWYGGESESLMLTGEVLYKLGKKTEALYYYRKAYEIPDFSSRMTYRRIYELITETEGENAARNFADYHLSELNKIRARDIVSNYVMNDAKDFCKDIYITCPFDNLYYQPMSIFIDAVSLSSSLERCKNDQDDMFCTYFKEIRILK